MNSILINKSFDEKYAAQPELIIQSPGRINIMGEHTDYNDGFVLPAAINYYIFSSFNKNQNRKIRLYSKDFDEEYQVELDDLNECELGWANLILGVVDQIKDRIEGFDLVFSGNIPKGAGLSSSAAICCSIAYGLNELFDLNLSKWDMVKIAQNSEHNFAHVNCGIMDQFACLFGITNHALQLNCLTLDYIEYEFDLEEYKLILINSNVPHTLHDSDYNARRKESQRAIELIGRWDSSVENYQNLSPEALSAFENRLNNKEYRRAKHIVTENQRVHDISEALANRQFEKAGKLLNESHLSEKDDYEITCKQTDYLVEELNKYGTIMGARQVGGGFGGCVLALARDYKLDELIEEVGEAYKKKFSLSLTNIPVKISMGCHKLEGEHV